MSQPQSNTYFEAGRGASPEASVDNIVRLRHRVRLTAASLGKEYVYNQYGSQILVSSSASTANKQAEQVELTVEANPPVGIVIEPETAANNPVEPETPAHASNYDNARIAVEFALNRAPERRDDFSKAA